MRLIHAFVVGVLVLLFVSLSGCGVQFREPAPTTDVLHSITAGPDAADGSLVFRLAYRQQYPVPIGVTCSLTEPSGTSARPPVFVTIPSNPSVTSANDATSGSIDLVFPAVPPGAYTVRCVTEKVGEALSLTIRIP